MTNDSYGPLRLGEILSDNFVLLPAAWSVALARRFLVGIDTSYAVVWRREQGASYYYLFDLSALMEHLSSAEPATLLQTMLDLQESRATPAMEVATAAEEVPDQAVALEGGRVVGVFDVAAALDFTPPRVRGLDANAPFAAFPALDAPMEVRPGATFTVMVGFHTDAATELSSVTPLSVPDAPPDATLLVMLIVDGCRVLDGHRRTLPLDMDAHATFTCQALPLVGEATLTVDYIYDSQVVGSATRAVKVTPEPAAEGRAAWLASDPCRLDYLPEAAVDLTLTLQQLRDGTLEWTIHAREPAVSLGPLPGMVPALIDAADFAASLLDELRQVGFRGAFAQQLLENKGEEIASLMPAEFWPLLQAVHTALQRPPTLLLRTNEPYIPWELALLETPLDPAAPPFLGAQSYLGRWLQHERVQQPPPLLIEVRRTTVVASNYGLGSGYRALPEALVEQEALCEQFATQGLNDVALKAERDDLEPVLTGARVPGHLIHFAVHGMSDPAADTQALLLADNSQLPSTLLVGRCHCCALPTFDFVFLNACQVGTAGRRLGQAAGFPGNLIRRGVRGFVAPLWEVQDRKAREMAEAFYAQTLAGNRRVAEFLQEARAAQEPAENLTPLAYIFYGHPNLRLHPRRENSDRA